MSKQGLGRHVERETGMTFDRWVRRFQMAWRRGNCDPASYHSFADKLGYESAAAFSAMFKKYMGQPPGRDLSTLRFSAKIGE